MALVIMESGDKRKFQRSDLDIGVFSMNGGQFIGKAKNISREGMYLETEENVVRDAKILLRYTLPGTGLPIKAYSVVKWIRENRFNNKLKHGVGIRFVSLNKSDLRKIDEFIKASSKKINSDNHSLADFAHISDKDLFRKAEVFWEYAEDMQQKGFINYRRPLVSSSKNRSQVIDEGTGKPRDMIMMGSNNYLGLTTHPRVIEVAKSVMGKYGVGAGSVPLLAGTYDLHRELELKLAELKGCEDAIVLSSGYITNLGFLQTMVKRGDIAIIDRYSHASIIDGCLISEGSFKTFKHSDIDSLRDVLQGAKDKYRGKIIIADGVYSMDGDIAPLAQIIEVAKEYGAKVMIDEAHATGVIGEMGRGTPSHFHLEGKVDIVMGTLSKALGGIGGFIASSRKVINYLRYYTRSFFYSTNIPPSTAASVIAAIEVMCSDTQLHKTLWKNIRFMKENLKTMGFNIGDSGSAIIPIFIGDELTLKKMSKRFHEEGVYLNAIPYPAVSKGSERFRLSILATHTKEDLEQTLGVLEKVGKEFGVIRKIIPLQYLRNNKTIVQEVKSEKEIEESVRFSWRVYENSPAWVPYFLVKEQTRLISGEYFYFRKITNKRFIVRDSGDIVGTISAFVDEYFNLLYNKRVGYLGFFEALPNREKAINLLFNKAIEFLKRENCKEVWAPINGIFELIGGGTLSDGFEKEPSFLQVYNPSYYREYFVQSGFMPFKQTLHYTINLDNQEILERVNSLSKKSLIPELKIRKVNKSDWENEVRRILKVFNESFVHLWFGIPLEYQEFIEFANKFKRLIIPDFWLIAEINDEPVGFIGGFPNYVKIFRELNGNIKFTKFLKMTLQIHRIEAGSILLFGVVDKYRKTGVGPLLSSRLCRAMIEKGYSRTAAAWILEDNTDCRRVAEWLGGKVDRTWTIYGKNLND